MQLNHLNGKALTKSQLLIWTGQKLSPGIPLYNMAFAFTIKGALDAPLFQQCFEKLVQKSDALRTVFTEQSGDVRQHVLPTVETTLPIIDFSTQAHPQAQAETYIQERTERPFNIEERIFDSSLLKLKPNEWVWHMAVHHVVFDGWSFSLCLKEMERLYQDIDEAMPAFANYLTYEAKAKENSKEAFWQPKIDAAPSHANMYGPVKESSTNTRRLFIDLGAERSEQLKALTQKDGFRAFTQNASLHNIFLTALFALLKKTTDQDAFSVGCTVHNRLSMEQKQTPGLFVELFPAQVEISPTETFTSLFKQVQADSFEMLKHAQPGSSSSQMSNSFNVVFNFIHAEFGEFAGHEMSSKWVTPGHVDAHHQLRMQVHDFDKTGRLHLCIDLNKDVFDEELSKRLPQQYLSILDSFTSNPNAALQEVSILTKEEIEESSKSAFTDPIRTSILEDFYAAIEIYADKPATHCEGRTLTYSELADQVSRLADGLKQKGIQQGDRVCICLPRTENYFISVLATLHIGAIYVPIPFDTPEKRVQYIVENARAAILIDEATFASTQSASAAKLVPNSFHANQSALIIYTSGSTGKPKGVEISHGGIVNYMDWIKADCTYGEEIHSPLCTSIGFDITATSLYLPMMTGGSVTFYPQRDKVAALVFEEVLENSALNLIMVTPSHLELFRGRNLSHLAIKHILVAGEDLKTALAKDTITSFGSESRLFNIYGPSEATIGCTYHLYNPEIDTALSVPIGRPIRNLKAYIMDKQGKPVTNGVIGELYMSGGGIAKGYWANPTLTSASFLPDVFHPEHTMYKTGDIARIAPNGDLEFFGREDDQVKLNGVRIELKEIEHLLTQIDGVEQAVVVMHKQGETAYLLAYYSGTEYTGTQLKEKLAKDLPPLMLPNRFIYLNEFPLTASGKINKRELPKPKAVAVQTEADWVDPRNEIEELVAGIWKDVLQVPKISVVDSFFNLGGHSLSAIQITSRISEILRFEMPLKTIFHKPTIAQYAEEIEAILREKLSALN